MPVKPFAATIRPGDRVALALEYQGSAFFGWQSQGRPQHPTVQDALQSALSKIVDQPVVVTCAGRTDAGVHASHQVVHFDCPVERLEKAFVFGGNTHLPDSVSIKWARPVAEDFHARFSATARRYRYVIHNTQTRSAHLSKLVTTIPLQFNAPLDAEKMHEAAQSILGERDFSSFRGTGCQSRTPMRNVHFVSVKRVGDFVIVDIQANAFLLHMVRNIVGSLLAVGKGEYPVEWIADVLDKRDRNAAGVTAPPDGLYLVDVSYPDAFGLPANNMGPAFIHLL
jgi:tRNA pseudouridine38-40 synthase